jgi:hypothetical protein
MNKYHTWRDDEYEQKFSRMANSSKMNSEEIVLNDKYDCTGGSLRKLKINHRIL